MYHANLGGITWSVCGELKSNPIFGFRIPMFPIHYVTLGSYHKQKAQLSQRGRAMVRVIEYFAKSLKVLLRLLVHNFYTEVQCTAENSSLLSWFVYCESGVTDVFWNQFVQITGTWSWHARNRQSINQSTNQSINQSNFPNLLTKHRKRHEMHKRYQKVKKIYKPIANWDNRFVALTR